MAGKVIAGPVCYVCGHPFPETRRIPVYLGNGIRSYAYVSGKGYDAETRRCKNRVACYARMFTHRTSYRTRTA